MYIILALITIGLFALSSCSSHTASSDPPTPELSAVRLIRVRNPAETRPDGATRLTTPPTGSSDQNPAFSPDGLRLVFTRFDQGYNDGPAGLFLLDLGSSQTIIRLTPIEDQDNVNLPGSAWNEVNNRIIFSSDRQDADGLWRIAPDRTDLSRIITHTSPITYMEPSWSPDGQWIVFEASQPGGSEDGRVGQVWKVRADGTGLIQLTDGTYDDRQPNWSPAGDRILFQRRALPNGQWDIYTIAPDGSDVRQVTLPPSSDADASWSPGGGCIVYSSDYADKQHPGGLAVANIHVISATGGLPARVTDDATYDGAPSWSPDGKWIAFESANDPAEDSPSALWLIAVPDGVCDDEFHVYLPITLTSAPSSGLLAVNDFLYQLQNLDLTAVGATAYDLVVMDYSTDGDDATAFTPAEIAALKNSPGGDKIVLSYMSIGEAEDYRFYWQSWWTPGNPPWLDEENPDWGGNYKVHYWDPAWQTIVFSYTDRLLDAGFDGAYLDIIDAYEYYSDTRATAAQDMADFVAAIRAHAHARDPDFYIFPQNAPELADEIPGYLDSVDGIGQEDIYYGYDDEDVMTPPAATAELEGYLDLFKNAGKLVLTVDYASTPAYIDDAYAKSLAKGYVPFVTVRDLDQLTINPGHEPD
jgi:TolB protein